MRLCCLLLSVSAFAAPHSSITIDRIARIKYPTDPIWSPDSKGIAFLWDAAGKQDLFLSQEGAAPLALTTFPVNPNMLQSDIGHVEWASPNSLIFAKDDALWRVETMNPAPLRLPGFDGVAVFTLSRDLQQMAFVRRGQIWVAN